MPRYEKAGEPIYKLMQDLIKKHHPDLCTVMDRIYVTMREPAAKSGGKPVLAKPSKFKEKYNALHGTNYVFEIELALEEWYQAGDDLTREAIMYNALCHLDVSVSEEEAAEEKYSLRAPDIVGFREEFERYGLGWRPEFQEADNHLPVFDNGVKIPRDDQ